MKVTCSSCGNSWELATGDLPAGNADFETLCGSCGAKVVVKRGSPDASQAGKASVQWFVAVGRDKKGPFDEDAVKKMITAGEVAPGGFVWRQGFENWKKASEVTEFAASFGAGHDDAGMVWQRRETSVLFSLDDYKQRKATRGQGTVKDGDVVDVRRLDEEPAPAGGAAGGGYGGGMISFDETEVQRVADALARKKKTKKGLLGLSIAVGAIVLVGVGGFVVYHLMGSKGGEVAQTEQVQPQNGQQAPAQAQAPAQGQAQAPAQDQAQAQAQAPAQDQGQATSGTAEKPAQTGDAGAAVANGADRRNERADARRERTEPRTRGEQAAEPQRQAEPERPARNAEQAAPQRQEAAAGAGNDANSLLAQLHSNRNQNQQNREQGGASQGGAGLPERLAVSQVMKGFNARKAAMEECVRNSGEAVPFSAKANVEIEGSGRVAGVRLSGGGAARSCLEGVLRSVTFDRFSGPNMRVPYTISIR